MRLRWIDPQVNRNKMVVDNVAVVIPRPTINPDEYQPFDYDLYKKTVEDVLSDESRFDNSFDEYSSGHADDTGSEYVGGRDPVQGKRLESEKQRDARARAQAQAQTRARLSGKKKSPYFPTGRVKKAAVTQRHITRIESESEEAEAEIVAAPADEYTAMSLEAAMPLYDGGGEAEVENERENAICEPVDEDDALGRFLLAHPFMKEGGYPVGRRARQKFVGQLREEAGALGMDADAVNELVKNVKTAYLETWAVGHTIQNDSPNGSEFGDEFDDKERKHKTRKRKRHGSEESKKQSRDKEKDKDKTSGSEVDFLPVRLKPVSIDINQATDTLLQSLPDLPNRDSTPTATVDNPVAIGEADGFSVKPNTLLENTERSGTSNVDSKLDHSPGITHAQHTHGNGSTQVDFGLRAHPVCLDHHDDTTSNAKGDKRNVTAGSVDKKQFNASNVGKLDFDEGKQGTQSKQGSKKRTERRRRRRQRLKEKRRERRESAINRNSPTAPVSGKQPENLHQDFY